MPVSSSTQKEIDEFLNYHSRGFCPVVCVTSGGTIVPLSTTEVPYIDNFSGGERGSNSVEYFLARGYVVIFLYRYGSKYPFMKNFNHHYDAKHLGQKLLSSLVYDPEDGAGSLSLNTSQLSPIQIGLLELEGKIMRNIKNYQYFLPVTFTTVNDYLELLEYIAKGMAFFGPRSLFYLAAAVSDFYIPNEQLAEIEQLYFNNPSNDLTLPLSTVPKKLGDLTSIWAPNAMVISFKLETDEQILLTKAEKAITKYHVHLVIANLLNSRRNHCVLVSSKDSFSLDAPQAQASSPEGCDYEHIHRNESEEVFIEHQLVDSITTKHQLYMFKKYEISFNLRDFSSNAGAGSDASSGNTPAEEAKQRNRQLLLQLIEKIYAQEQTLMCKQIQYYLHHTNTKSAEETTSAAFQKNVQTSQSEPQARYTHFSRNYRSLLTGVLLMATISAINYVRK